ncbi:hypothetical protein WR25_22933 [Diploscapter pachys]|uniref:Uncharacterized protein n=1 Tax=Diploscapter pachys TaxID=2018661 RepID=A0A2A2JZ22_9BILA|nr:hypothetical protein WR25_22933 [Diploscapter pachys]
MLPTPVARRDPVFEPGRATRLRHVGDRGRRVRHILGVHDADVATAEQLRFAPAQHLRPGRADGGHHPHIIGARQHVLRQRPQSVTLGDARGDLFLQRFVELAQPLFGAGPLDRGLDAFGDVLDQRDLRRRPDPRRRRLRGQHADIFGLVEHHDVDEGGDPALRQSGARIQAQPLVTGNVAGDDRLP